MVTLTAEARLAEARELLALAKKELQDAEIEVMRKDAKLVAARANLRLVKRETWDELHTPPFKKMTEAIQTIEMYAIMHGISLGPTMDALTERLSTVKPE